MEYFHPVDVIPSDGNKQFSGWTDRYNCKNKITGLDSSGWSFRSIYRGERDTQKRSQFTPKLFILTTKNLSVQQWSAKQLDLLPILVSLATISLFVLAEISVRSPPNWNESSRLWERLTGWTCVCFRDVCQRREQQLFEHRVILGATFDGKIWSGAVWMERWLGQSGEFTLKMLPCKVVGWQGVHLFCEWRSKDVESFFSAVEAAVHELDD